MTRTRSSRPRRARRGFTLVELMITVLLLSVGITGIIASSTVVSRMMGGSAQQISAAGVAATRFEKLRGMQCSSVAAGTASMRGIREHWVATAVNARTYDVTDSVSYVPIARHASVTQVFRSFVTC